MTTSVKAALESAAAGELARRRLLDFATLVNPKFQVPTHIRYLARLLEDAEARGLRLAISAPPGHGKSALLQTFVAWCTGRNPVRRILAISASESLAKRNSRDAQALVTGEQWPWPDVSLATDSVLEWSTNHGGEVRAIGKGGVVTGFRASGGILCDDLQSDAGSEATRASDFEWFRAVLTTRLEPTAWCVLIQTRWNDGDIIGCLREGESADQWLFVNLPAIALDASDPLKRLEGEALWPERWPVEKLDAIKAEVGSSVFSSLYMGDPVPAGGALFKPEWFNRRYDTVPTTCATANVSLAQTYNRFGFANPLTEVLLKQPTIVVQAIDAAAKTGLSNDRSAIVTVASDLLDYYVLDCWVGRVGYPDLKRIAVEEFMRHRPRAISIESASNGVALIDDLRMSTSLPILALTAKDSKIARAESVSALFEAGRVLFPKSAAWVEEAQSECCRFPFGKHDDIADSLVWALMVARDNVNRALAYQTMHRQIKPLSDWMAR